MNVSILDDQTLLKTYEESVKLGLDRDFLQLLTKELQKRQMKIPA
ncbi:sporulation histidine kinase inhibitor Sda [Halobacillus locisalis]|uniref:Sporulation histidine kinase inhibitor Sda n=1 Tax=Halobacillus locisalis TaxID=220753 RepID=A0A838CN79_9BACI|nr:sporulation histidine kinase inhibitor Sda [Halobacillus locisalis]MBA2173414.1 sporulation histidine kinase inhibitor Sda [Halobacillus locisalis]